MFKTANFNIKHAFLVQNMMSFSYSYFSKDFSVSRNKFIAISLPLLHQTLKYITLYEVSDICST